MARAGSSCESLRDSFEAWKVSDVAGVIAEAEAAARRGWYAAGFVAYEGRAAAFDEAFRIKSGASRDETIPHLPLAWFGLFAESEDVASLHSSAATNTEPDPRALRAEITDLALRDRRIARRRRGVRAIRGAIADGTAYLVNHTTRFRRSWAVTEDPFSLYRQLVTGHNGGYHAYIETTDSAIACGSPEMFFDFRGRALDGAAPMKGTAPRGRSGGRGRAEQAAALSTSAKEQAENIMVVDLLRNDMGRIAETGSVAVPQLWRVERHPSVWQLTSTVTARDPPAETGLADVFGALFPCASVTGAPKIYSAMAIVAELELAPRGVYCGRRSG